MLLRVYCSKWLGKCYINGVLGSTNVTKTSDSEASRKKHFGVFVVELGRSPST
jgi:hypothetical protein